MPELRVIEGTGELQEHECEGCHRLQGAVDGLAQDLLNAEADLRKLRAQVRALRTDRDAAKAKAMREYVNREDVERLMQLWRDECNHKRSKLDPARFDRLKWGLETYGYGMCALVILAAGRDPYINKRGERVDRISFLFGDAEVFEQHANRGARIQRRA